MVKRLLLAGVAVLVLRWAALEIAAYAARNCLPKDQRPPSSDPAPGHHPGPFG
jgi:hypothetical protein